MTQISTLVSDIYRTVTSKDGWFTQELANYFAQDVSQRLLVKFNETQGPGKLRMSKLGPTCPRALWHSVRTPELAEPLPPWAEIKYSFGHMIEAQAIMLTKAAGHQVEGEQDVVTLDGVTGHRDCVIDGCTVDVKSCSSIAFSKFQNGSILQNDTFGYLDQLDAYVCGSSDDPIVRVKDRGYILAVDKTLGKVCLYEHRVRPEHIRRRIALHKQWVGQPTPPDCQCETEPDGSSGNIKLGTRASYSPFKYCCFPRLRTFLYSNGPRYLTVVARTPDVTEVDKYGKIVYKV